MIATVPGKTVECPKCKTENRETVTYCIRCHQPLKYTCPACRNVQLQGGKCEKCGVDFAKYMAMMIFQAKESAQQERKNDQGWNPPVWMHLLFFPIPLLIMGVLYAVRKAQGK